MKTKTEIKNKIAELYLKIEELRDDETHGWSNNTPDIEILHSKIKALKWVINI